MFQNLLFACALTSTLGLASIKEDIRPSYKSDEVSFHYENKKMVSYNDETYSITLVSEELNDYSWHNLNNYLVSLFNENIYLNNILDGINVTNYNVTYEPIDEYVDNLTFNYEEGFAVDDVYSFYYSNVTEENDNVYSYSVNFDNYKFTFMQDDGEDNLDDYIDFGSIDIYCYNTYYSGFKSAIDADIQANSASDDMPKVLDDFVGVLTTAIGSLASGIAGGVTAMAQDLFLQDDGEGNITGLSVFGGIVALFAGLALAVAITTKVYTWVTSLGN